MSADDYYKVLYCKSYGGFRISNIQKLKEKFADEIFDEYGYNYPEEVIDASLKTRDNQELINYMIEQGLDSFNCRGCVLEIGLVHHLFNYKIQEYDGKERVLLYIDYEKICRDLLDNTENSKCTSIVKEKGVDYLNQLMRENQFNLN